MQKKNIIAYIASGVLLFSSCKKQLDYIPTGVLSSTDLTSPTAVDGLVTAAYAAIGNGDMIGPIYSNWAYGSVRSDDAYKGGGDSGGEGSAREPADFGPACGIDFAHDSALPKDDKAACTALALTAPRILMAVRYSCADSHPLDARQRHYPTTAQAFAHRNDQEPGIPAEEGRSNGRDALCQ